MMRRRSFSRNTLFRKDAIIDLYSDMPGVRDLEQAAEHLAANALFQIETKHLAGVTFNADDVRSILLS